MTRQGQAGLTAVQEELRSVVEQLRRCHQELMRLRARLPTVAAEEFEAVSRGERAYSLAGALTLALDGALRDTLARVIADLDGAARETPAELERQWRQQFPGG